MPENELFKTALNKAMALCAAREYCSAEIAVKLNAWGMEDKESARIIEHLKKDNFINEERYALGFVKDKFKYNKWGKLKISAHLKAKNLPSSLINKALDTLDNKIYRQMLNNLLISHRRTVKAKSQYDLKAKLMRYGLSKGFESSLLYDLLNEMEL
ncbi:MAG: RecX family transcriptional regulator [Bacteroidales bacterium]|nr:RecX family transcriptional regulator [Bacteroidales bacterium]